MLSSRPPLSRVVLSVCSGLGPDLPVALAQLAQLADLDLSYTAVGRVRPLLAGCSGLTRLCLGSCRELQAAELLDLLPTNVSGALCVLACIRTCCFSGAVAEHQQAGIRNGHFASMF